MSDKSDNWGNVAFITLIIFIALLFGALLAQNYKEVVNLGPLGEYPRYPYKEYTIPLAIGAVLSLIIALGGYVAMFEASRGHVQSTAPPPQYMKPVNYQLCPICNQVNPQGASFCNTCGRSLA